MSAVVRHPQFSLSPGNMKANIQTAPMPPKIKQVAISDLQPNPKNHNKGTERGRYALEHSFRQYGAGRSILIDKNGKAIAGNHALEVAADIGLENVIIVETDGNQLVAVKRTDLDLDDPKAIALAYADNRTQELGFELDLEQLRADLDDGLDLSALWTDDEFNELLDLELPEEEKEEDEGAIADLLDKAESGAIEARCKVGEVWQLGKSRLAVGDCTNPKVMKMLMGEDLADAIISDPPFGVSVVGGTKDPRDAKNYQSGDDIENDSLSDEDLEDLLRKSLLLCRQYSKAGASYYVWHPDRKSVIFGNVIEEVLSHHRQIIVWAKENFVFSRLDHHPQHELCFYGWIPGAAHTWLGDRKQSTLWSVEKVGTDLEKKMHPSAKPVGLFQKSVENSVPRGGIALDPFLGSGTAIIACQRSGRACYGCELDPKYAEVICRRYEEFTGDAAKLVDRLS